MGKWEEMDVEKAKKVLIQIKRVLDKHQIPFWFGLGTLLGAIRDHKFVDGDSDIDLYTWDVYTERFKGFLKEFYELGFDVGFDTWGVSLNKDGVHTSLDFIHKDEYYNTAEEHLIYFSTKNIITKVLCYFILTCPTSSKYQYLHKETQLSQQKSIIGKVHRILMHFPFKKFMYNGAYKLFKLAGGVYIRIATPLDYILPLRKVDFLGEEFMVPNQSEKYLEYLYGDDWRIPKKYFNLTPDSKFPYLHFKGTYFTNLVYCPKCKKPQFVNNPHKKDDGKPLIISQIIGCDQCGNHWKEKFFVTGPVVKKFVIQYNRLKMEDKDLAYKDLKTFKKFCDKHGISFWLDGGTTLGAVRTGEFVPWEEDIDIGMKQKDLEKLYECRKDLEKKGYRFFPKQQGYAIIGKNRTSKLDIYSFDYDDEYANLYDVERNIIGNLSELVMFVLNKYDGNYKYETILSGRTINRLVRIVSMFPEFIRRNLLHFFLRFYWKYGVSKHIHFKIPKRYFDKFTKIKFYDDYYDIPYETESYLETYFGKTWRTPIRFTNNKEDKEYKWNGFNNTTITE
jgi:lipopolysaccharide cholinephosphotransferase